MLATDPFKQLREEARKLYDSIDKVKSPALNADVLFRAEGFHHLRYGSNNFGKERKKPEMRNKLANIDKAVIILKKSTTVQEYRCYTEPVGLKNSHGFRGMEKVHYYGFWAILEDKTRYKVIVRQVGAGEYNFWSVMPYWTEKLVNRKKARILAPNTIVDE
jgi:hypothetical protein